MKSRCCSDFGWQHSRPLKPSSQYDASRRKAPRCDATSCQNLPAQRYNFAWHLLLLRQVVRRRSEQKKVYSERQLHDVATRHVASRGLASYCELGFTPYNISCVVLLQATSMASSFVPTLQSCRQALMRHCVSTWNVCHALLTGYPACIGDPAFISVKLQTPGVYWRPGIYQRPAFNRGNTVLASLLVCVSVHTCTFLLLL